MKPEKCVVVLDGDLSAGLLANTAAILGITLGKELPEVVGPGVGDRSGREHLGIIAFPVPVLRSTPEGIRALRERLYEPDFQELTAVDFSDVAQSCKTYGEFTEKMRETPEEALRYFGLAVCGTRKRLTG